MGGAPAPGKAPAPALPAARARHTARAASPAPPAPPTPWAARCPTLASSPPGGGDALPSPPLPPPTAGRSPGPRPPALRERHGERARAVRLARRAGRRAPPPRPAIPRRPAVAGPGRDRLAASSRAWPLPGRAGRRPPGPAGGRASRGERPARRVASSPAPTSPPPRAGGGGANRDRDRRGRRRGRRGEAVARACECEGGGPTVEWNASNGAPPIRGPGTRSSSAAAGGAGALSVTSPAGSGWTNAGGNLALRGRSAIGPISAAFGATLVAPPAGVR